MSDMIPISKEGGLEPHRIMCSNPECNEVAGLTIGVTYKIEMIEGGYAYVLRDERAKFKREFAGKFTGDWVYVPPEENIVVTGEFCSKCKDIAFHVICEECGMSGWGFNKDVHDELRERNVDGVKFTKCEQHQGATKL